jgi:hypothetical protein
MAGDGGPAPIAGGHVDASVPVLPPVDAMAPDCAWLELETRRVVPTVHLVLDASESMGEGADPPWAALGEALFASPGGVVAELDRLIAFSATFYTDDPACPTLTEVGPRLLNRYPIEELYDSLLPTGRTPTAEAIDAVVTQYGGASDGDDGRSAIILATDGTPTGCAAASSQEAFDAMVASARHAAEADLPVHVISLAPTLTSAEGLQRTANVGLGLPEGERPGAPIHAPGDAEELQATLRELLDDTLDCRLAVEGELQVARACEGEVTLDDEPLPCDDGNGWRAVDATHVELLGTACDRLQRSAATRISARFPCDVARPF